MTKILRTLKVFKNDILRKRKVCLSREGSNDDYSEVIPGKTVFRKFHSEICCNQIAHRLHSEYTHFWIVSEVLPEMFLEPYSESIVLSK